jgi:N-acetylglucosamine-6-phosphate deacetylase
MPTFDKLISEDERWHVINYVRNSFGNKDEKGVSPAMIDAVRNLHGLGIPLEHALEAATAVPARVLGTQDVGHLEVGQPADVVVLSDTLEIERVLVGGETRLLA